MPRFYSNENIAAQVVTELRRLGHDILTSLEAGKANAAVPDTEVLAFAAAQGRILLSHTIAGTFSGFIGTEPKATRESCFAPLTRTSPGRRDESRRRLRSPAT